MSNKTTPVPVQPHGVFKWIERIGNKIPDPFMLFVYLLLCLIIISAALSAAGVTVVNPISQKAVAVKSLLSIPALHWFLSSMVTNFAHFPVFGLVLVISLGIGLLEKTGLMTALVKSFVFKIPRSTITFALLFICFFSHMASDVAFVIMPPLGAMIFLSVNRHPLAGFATALAGVGAGFTANIFITTTDVLLSGISTEAAKMNNPNITVTPLDNWIFMAFSVFFLCALATFITEKVVEPRLGKYTGNKAVELENITAQESRALRSAGIVALIFMLTLIALVVPESALLRNPITGGIPNSPFIKGIVPLLFFFFLTVGLTYGLQLGFIKSAKDVSRLMGESIKQLSGFIVLVFAISQFTAAFTWANLGEVVAISGAELLKSINMVGLPSILGFMVLCSIVSLFIPSGSAMWALLAPMFLPMFMMLDYHPAFIQMAFRIAMSVTIPIIPTNPFLPLFLKCMVEYDENAGIGTYLSLMLPYTIYFLILWPLLMVIWYLIGLPIGPGVFPKL